jgi:hypothetical protein
LGGDKSLEFEELTLFVSCLFPCIDPELRASSKLRELFFSIFF